MKTAARLGWAIVGFTVALFIGTQHASAHSSLASQESSLGADNVQGVKSKLVTQAVKLMAKALRKGEKPFFDACEKLASDPRALKAFRKHAGKIADVLDEIAKIPDLVLGSLVKSYSSCSRQIADPSKWMPGPQK
jgi:hypothetical protein